MDQVILVDNKDNEVGECEKLEAHHRGLLHRAISVFIFKKTGPGDYELLLQKRNATKYHSGGLWSNTCCSHPRPGEKTLDAAHRRLKEEMGFDSTLNYAGSFIYKAEFSKKLIEHEMDHVYIGYFDKQKISPNPEEVSDYKWIDVNLLFVDYEKHSKKYTAWFETALSIAVGKLELMGGK